LYNSTIVYTCHLDKNICNLWGGCGGQGVTSYMKLCDTAVNAVAFVPMVRTSVYIVSPNTKDLSYSLKVTQGFLSKVGHVELVRDSVLFAVWHSAVS
jgi:hypothetical protein